MNKALLAVEMTRSPNSAFCSAKTAPVCSAGGTPKYTFNDDLEDTSTGNWTKITDAGSANYWSYPQNPNPIEQDMTNATSGETNLFGLDVNVAGDYSIAMTDDITLPANEASYLRFNHDYWFDFSLFSVAYDYY